MQVKLMSMKTQVREVKARGTATRSGVPVVSRGQTRQDLEGKLRFKGLRTIAGWLAFGDYGIALSPGGRYLASISPGDWTKQGVR